MKAFFVLFLAGCASLPPAEISARIETSLKEPVVKGVLEAKVKL